jgi:putative ABC transport system permease protein
MNQAIFRKAKADLFNRRWQSLITLMLALLIQRSSSDPWEQAFQATNGADAWFRTIDATTDLSPIAKLNGVIAASQPSPLLPERNVVIGTKNYGVSLYGLDKMPELGRPVVTDGRWLDITQSAEIVLDRSFARNLKLAVGDRLNIETGQGLVSLKVVGLAINTIRGPYPDNTPGLAYTSTATLSQIEPDKNRWNYLMGIKTQFPGQVSLVASRAVGLGIGFGWYTTESVRESVEASTRINALFLGVFGLFALFACGLILANVISGVVLAQYREIGVLKAIGYTPRQVTLVFLLEYSFLGFTAAIGGIITGSLLAPLFLQNIAEVLNAPQVGAFDPWLAGVVLLGMEFTIALFTFIPAWKGGKVPAVQALTVGYSRVQTKPSRLVKLARLLKLPLSILIGVKDAFTRKLRAWLTMFSLALTVITVVFVLALQLSIQWVTYAASNGLPADIQLFRAGVPEAEVQGILSAQPEVAAYYRYTEWPASAGGVNVKTRAVDKGYEQFPFSIIDGRMLQNKGEVVVGLGLLNSLNLKIGDELNLTLKAMPPATSQDALIKLKIVGSYIVTNNQGKMAVFSLDDLLGAIPKAGVPSYALKLVPGADAQLVSSKLQAASNDQFQLRVYDNALPEQVHQVRWIMLGLGMVLLLVGVINLLNTAWLGVRERFREMGIFKTIGFTPLQVIGSVITSASLLTIGAVVMGVPVGLLLARLLFDLLLGTGLGVLPSLELLLLLLPCAIMLTTIACFLPALIAAKAKVVEVLQFQ